MNADHKYFMPAVSVSEAKDNMEEALGALERGMPSIAMLCLRKAMELLARSTEELYTEDTRALRSQLRRAESTETP